MIVVNMSQELEEIIKKIVEKYKINGLKEPLLSQQNITYLLWRLKGFAWHEIEKDLGEYDECDLPLYADRLFDEISSLSDTWINMLISFNSECLQYINNKKIVEILIDMLVLRSIYYQLSKPY